MPEQAAKEIQSDTVLKKALQESQIRNIHLRTIEVKLEGEIDELKASWLTPKHEQKAAMLEYAKTLVTKLMRDGEEEQRQFEGEMEQEK